MQKFSFKEVEQNSPILSFLLLLLFYFDFYFIFILHVRGGGDQMRASGMLGKHPSPAYTPALVYILSKTGSYRT
jgi:hypothetical protein